LSFPKENNGFLLHMPDSKLVRYVTQIFILLNLFLTRYSVVIFLLYFVISHFKRSAANLGLSVLNG